MMMMMMMKQTPISETRDRKKQKETKDRKQKNRKAIVYMTDPLLISQIPMNAMRYKDAKMRQQRSAMRYDAM